MTEIRRILIVDGDCDLRFHQERNCSGDGLTAERTMNPARDYSSGFDSLAAIKGRTTCSFVLDPVFPQSERNKHVSLRKPEDSILPT